VRDLSHVTTHTVTQGSMLHNRLSLLSSSLSVWERAGWDRSKQAPLQDCKSASEIQPEENIFVIFPPYIFINVTFMLHVDFLCCVRMCILLLPSNEFEVPRTRLLLLIIMKQKRFDYVTYSSLSSLIFLVLPLGLLHTGMQ